MNVIDLNKLMDRVFGSRARSTLAFNLVKARNSSIPLSVSRLAFISGLGRGNLYRVLRDYLSSGLAERVDNGYIASSNLLKVVEPFLDKLDEPFNVPSKFLPDTIFYLVRVPFREWYGPMFFLYVIDARDMSIPKLTEELEKARRRAKSLLGDERGFSWVFVRNIGRRYVEGYFNGIPVSSIEQGFADLFSFSPDPFAYVIDFLWNIDKIDVDLVYDLCSNDRCRGIVASVLATYTFITGRLRSKRSYFSYSFKRKLDCYSGARSVVYVRDNVEIDPWEKIKSTAVLWIIPEPVRSNRGW